MGDKLWSLPFKYTPQSKGGTADYTASWNQTECALEEYQQTAPGRQR